MRHSAVLARPLPGTEAGLNAPDERLRVIVLDDDEKLIQAVEDALWMWPRSVSYAAHIEDVVSQCAEAPPTAVLIAIDRNAVRETQTLPALRRRLPATPIVAVATPVQAAEPWPYLELGADALLIREDACRPGLYALLQRIQRRSHGAGTVRRFPALATPWARSKLFGALIADHADKIVDCNRTLARWLCYQDQEELIGRSLRRDVLVDVNDWRNWGQVAFDTDAFLQRRSPVLTATGRVTILELEVFASPADPGFIQALFARYEPGSPPRTAPKD